MAALLLSLSHMHQHFVEKLLAFCVVFRVEFEILFDSKNRVDLQNAQAQTI